MLKKLLVVLTLGAFSQGCSHTFDSTRARIKLHGFPGYKEVSLSGCVTPKEHMAQTSEMIVKDHVKILDEGAFQNLDHMEHLHLNNLGIEEIVPGAFRNLPKLHTVSLRGNRIRSIPEGVFNGLPIRRLYLGSNMIDTIDPKAFNDLPNLEDLYLDNNLIDYWNPDWFRNSPNLRVIYLNNNKISEIHDHVLQNFNRYDKTVRKIALFNNRIKTIAPDAFSDVNHIDTILLHNNLIESFEVDRPVRVNVLVLQNNRLRCFPDSFLKNMRIKYRLHVVNNPLENICLQRLRSKAMTERFVLASNSYLLGSEHDNN